MIQYKALPFNSFQVNTYIIWDDTFECAVIDPAFNSSEEREYFDKFIKDHNLKPVRQMNTHCHADHLPGVTYMKTKYQLPFSAHRDEARQIKNAPVMGRMFGFDLKDLTPVGQYIDDNEIISFGNSTLKAILVPGHSEGSLAYYSAEGHMVMTGDALFRDSIGRTDFPGGDHDTLIRSIREKLFSLPPDTVVCPGHGPFSTIGEEIGNNPYFN